MKITMREFDVSKLTPVEKLTGVQIKAIREEVGIGVTSFAVHLGVTPETIEQWEQGIKSPNGTALKLLTLVKKKGLKCIA